MQAEAFIRTSKEVEIDAEHTNKVCIENMKFRCEKILVAQLGVKALLN